jgi:hypothetical protein
MEVLQAFEAQVGSAINILKTLNDGGHTEAVSSLIDTLVSGADNFRRSLQGDVTEAKAAKAVKAKAGAVVAADAAL